MTYSARLGRHVDVAIEQLNDFQDAEFGAALAALPTWPDVGAADVRAEAAKGNINALVIIDIATETQNPGYLDYI